jgi:hypothetical protein
MIRSVETQRPNLERRLGDAIMIDCTGHNL